MATRTIRLAALALAISIAAACTTPVGPPSSAKAITSFYFLGYGGYSGDINEAQGTITATLPVTVGKSGLVAVFATSGASVTVGSVNQASGTTPNDFTNPVTYRVTAKNGSTKDYIVTVGSLTAALIQGSVTTLAGNSPGSADGMGSAARFNGCIDVAEYGGFLYVADYLNSVIRRVDSATGEVTTFAGSTGVSGSMDGVGSAARFRWPQSIVSDGIGNLFVADPAARAIRKIVIGTAQVSTIATSMSVFNWPQGMAVDGDFLYVANKNDHTVLRVDTRTPDTVTVFAGVSGTSGSQDGTGASATFNQPSGIAKIGGTLYVTDNGNATIRAIDIASAAVSTFAGTAGTPGSANGSGTAARFNYPIDIASVGTNLYVTDWGLVRAISTPTANVTTFAGSYRSEVADGIGTAASFESPWGIGADAQCLYVTDFDNNTLRKIDIGSAQVSTLAGSPTCGAADGTGGSSLFRRPYGIVSDGANLYVADCDNSTVRAIEISSGTVRTIAGLAGSSGSTDGAGSAARFRYPQGIALHGGELFVADTYNNTIRRLVLATGQVSTFAGTAGSSGSADGTGGAARFNQPAGIATDGVHLYIADTLNHTIRKAVIATGEVTTIAGTAGSSGSGDGAGSAASFNRPMGLATDGTNLYVVDTYNSTIRMLAIATNEVSTLAGSSGSTGHTNGTGVAARFWYPYGIATDGTRLYVADIDYIRSILIATGEVTTLAGGADRGSIDGTGSAARFNQACGIACDGAGVYVADTVNNSIRVIR